jgi:dolichol-phosphate mannosyltransferase
MTQTFIILPCLNEESALPHFKTALTQALDFIQGHAFHLIWIDDGSQDQTWAVIKSFEDSDRIHHQGIRFVRNFGHQAAIQAGCESTVSLPQFSSESRVLVMDSDGQHPVECIDKMLTALKEYRHVQMIRFDTDGASAGKKASSSAFYSLFRTFTDIDLPNGAADFRGMQGSVLLNYLKFTESGRFNRGLFHLAEPPHFLEYTAKARAHGVSKYNLFKMLKLAFVGITSFSNKPLILASFTATTFGFMVCIGYFGFELFRLLNGRTFQPGWFTIMAWISMWGMILSFCMLLLSIYIGRIFDETKKRPIYLIREKQ